MTADNTSLPQGWSTTTLGALLDRLQYGYTASASKTAVGPRFLRITDLQDYGVDWGAVPTCVATSDVVEKYKLADGDFVFARSGSIDKAWRVRNPPESVFASYLMRGRPHLAETAAWLEQFIRSASYLEQIGAAGAGIGMANINATKLAAVELPFPPLAEQGRILAKVVDLTARSRRAKQALAAIPPLLNQLRQSILAAAFRGDLTSRDVKEERETSKVMARVREQHETLRAGRKKLAKGPPSDWADLPQLPHGWSWERSEDIVEPETVITYGIVLPGKHVEAGIPYIRGQDIEDGKVLVHQLLRTTPQIAEKHRRSELQEGDVLLCIIRHLKVALVPSGLGGANLTQGTVRLRPSQAIDGKFLAYYLSSAFAQNWMKGRYFGLAMPRINVEDAREIPVPVAPLEEQREIVATIDAMDQHLSEIGSQVAAATAEHDRLAQSLLAKAFQGELVPQDSNDEPASVLLERIRAARVSAESTLTGKGRRLRKAVAVVEVAGKADAGGDDDGDDGDDGDAADDGDGGGEDAAPQPATRSRPGRHPARDLSEIDPEILQAAVFAALWTQGPLEKDDAVRRVAEHLRQARHVDFQRLRADGPLYGQILAALESAAKAGRLDRPKRGYVRACKADATAYRVDDWRHALLASLGAEPVDQDDAIRAAAEWARDQMGLAFTRLRGDGHIAEGLRSAINSAIRRGEVVRHSATRISRAPSSGREAAGQLSLTLDAPAGGTGRGGAARSHRGA